MKASQLITHPPSSPTYRRSGLAIPEPAKDRYGFFRPTDEVREAWEPRGDWQEDTVRGICKELGLLHCTDALARQPLWGDPWYLRLHGGAGYRHRYSRGELTRLRALVEGRRALVLFNDVSMLADARTFAGLLGAEP